MRGAKKKIKAEINPARKNPADGRKTSDPIIIGNIQTIMLLARAHGLHTCPQEAWTNWHKTLKVFLDLPSEHILFCGIALGYADDAAPINAWRSERESVDSFTRFEGF